MIVKKINIKENEYFNSPVITKLLIDITSKIENLKLEKINIFNILLGYPKKPWLQETDIFQYISSECLNQLKNSNYILIFDATLEGYSEAQLPLISCLEFNCKKYNINPKKVFLFTGNLLSTSDIINVIPIYNIDCMINPLLLDVNNSKKISSKLYKDKIFLSLSRRNRKHRVLAHCMLFHSDIFPFGLISQSNTKDYVINERDLLEMNINLKQFKRFQKSLPLIADSNCFHVNQPGNILSELHHSTLFSIVNETLVNNYNNTTLFFSEKILKPIVNYQPMVIYGHQGINCKLNMLGYKSYEDYFDLSFDDEPNDIIRYQKLLKSISPLIKELSLKSKDYQLEWRYKNKELLEYNYKNFFLRKHTEESIELFINKIKNLFC